MKLTTFFMALAAAATTMAVAIPVELQAANAACFEQGRKSYNGSSQ